MSYPGSGGPHDPEDSRQPPGQPSAGSGEHHDQPGPYGNQPGQYGGQPDPGYGDQSGQYGQPGYGGRYGQYANEQPGSQYGYQQPADQYGYQQPGGQYGNQQPGGQYGNPGQYGQYGQSSRTNVLAILSLVFAFVFAPAGIALGHLALRQIGRTGERGRQLALSGLILSYFFTALYLVGCCGWLALAGWAGSDGGGSAY